MPDMLQRPSAIRLIRTKQHGGVAACWPASTHLSPAMFGPPVQTEMPYDYYSMPFCKPPEGVQRATSTINPGTILLGIRIENSPYNFTIMVRSHGV